jgi:hypothetical protein
MPPSPTRRKTLFFVELMTTTLCCIEGLVAVLSKTSLMVCPGATEMSVCLNFIWLPFG